MSNQHNNSRNLHNFNESHNGNPNRIITSPTVRLLNEYAQTIQNDEDRTDFVRHMIPLILNKLQTINDEDQKIEIIQQLLQIGFFDREILQNQAPSEWKNKLEAKHLNIQLTSNELFHSNLKLHKHINTAYQSTLNYDLINRYINILSSSYESNTMAAKMNDAILLIECFNPDRLHYPQIIDIIRNQVRGQPAKQIHKFLVGITFQFSQELTLPQIANRISQRSGNFDFTSNPQRLQIVCNNIKWRLNLKSQSYINYLQQQLDKETSKGPTLKEKLQTLFISEKGQNANSNDSHKSKIAKKYQIISNKRISQWNKQEIQEWSSLVQSKKIQTSRDEIIASVFRAAQIANGYQPRNTQLMTVIIFLNKSSESGLLAQVNTGEGKSLIIAMLAAILALEGKAVDVVTTSMELAIPEVKKQTNFFSMLSLSVDSNNNGSSSNYNANVVYGTSLEFSGDILRTEFELMDIRRKRPIDVVIVDEADSKLYDDRNTRTMLSSITPTAHHLDLLLAMAKQCAEQFRRHCVTIQGRIYYIKNDFEVINHQIFTNNNEQIERTQIVNFNQFLKDIIKQRLQSLTRQLQGEELKDYEDYKRLHEKLARKNLINELGTKYCPNITEEQKLMQLKKISPWFFYLINKDCKENLPEDLQQTVLNHRWHSYSKIVEIPKHLQEFVRDQIPRWTDSLFNSIRRYQKDIHYIIRQNKIKVVDHSNTGVIYENMVWSDGLAQFLQIKEDLPIQSQQISTNFLSTPGFFRKYGSNIYGLTGTLGSQSTKDFYRTAFGLDSVVIPPHNYLPVAGNQNSNYICKEFPTIICSSQLQRINQIVSTNILYVKCGQAALIICQNIKEVHQISQILIQRYQQDKIFKYTGQQTFTKHNIDSGQILVATFIAGRGTDIITSQNVQQNGGLHICVTLLPENLRVQLQNVGRTARQGKRGTAQLIVLSEISRSISEIKALREQKENREIESALNQMNKMVFKDKIFQQYCKLISEIIPDESKVKKLQEYSKITKQWDIHKACYLSKDKIDQQYNKHCDKIILEKYKQYNPSYERLLINQSIQDVSAQQNSEVQTIYGELNQIKTPISSYRSIKEIKDLHNKIFRMNIPKRRIDINNEARRRKLYLIYRATCEFDQKLKEITDSVKGNQEVKEVFKKNYNKKIFDEFIHVKKSLYYVEIIEHMREGKVYSLPENKYINSVNWTQQQKKAVHQRWGFWMNKHFHNISASEQSQNQVTAAFQIFKQQLQKDAIDNTLIKNPIYYIKKGIYLCKDKLACFDKAIELDKQNSVNAHYNKALLLLINAGKSTSFTDAKQHLRMAMFLIFTYGKQNVINLLSNLPNSGPDTPLKKKVVQRLNILIKQQDYIQKAIANILQAEEKQWYVSIDYVSLKKAFEDADQNHDDAIIEAKVNGLSTYFTVTPKQPTNYLGLIFCTLLGVAQIIGGLCLMVTPLASIGTSLIYEGINDIFSSVKSMVTDGKFSWLKYGIAKAVSLATSVCCWLYDKVAKVASQVHSSISSAFDSVKSDIFKSIQKSAIRTSIEIVAQHTFQKQLQQKIENVIFKQIQQNLQSLLHQKTFADAIQLDNKHKVNILQNHILSIGSKIINEKAWWQKCPDFVTSVGSGVLCSKVKDFSPVLKVFSGEKAMIEFGIAAGSFISNLKQKLQKDKKFKQTIQKMKNTEITQTTQSKQDWKSPIRNINQQNYTTQISKQQIKLRAIQSSKINKLVHQFASSLSAQVAAKINSKITAPIINSVADFASQTTLKAWDTLQQLKQQRRQTHARSSTSQQANTHTQQQQRVESNSNTNH